MPGLRKAGLGRELSRPQPAPRFRLIRAVPVSVRVAAYLEFGLATLGFLLLATTLLFFDWNAYVADTGGPIERDGVQLEVISAGAVAIAVTALALNSAVVLLTVIFAVGVLRGANWARIGITILFGLGAIAQFASPPDPISMASGLLELVAVILLWLATSNRYFRSVKLDRAMYRSRRFA
jgi:hypothetical protein